MSADTRLSCLLLIIITKSVMYLCISKPRLETILFMANDHCKGETCRTFMLLLG